MRLGRKIRLAFDLNIHVCHINATARHADISECVMNSFCLFISRCLFVRTISVNRAKSCVMLGLATVLTRSRLIFSFPHLHQPFLACHRHHILSCHALPTDIPITTTKTIYRSLLASRSDSSRQRMSSSRTINSTVSLLLPQSPMLSSIFYRVRSPLH